MARKRASMREGPLAELFKATEAAQRQAEEAARQGQPAPEEPQEATVEHVPTWEDTSPARRPRYAPAGASAEPPVGAAPASAGAAGDPGFAARPPAAAGPPSRSRDTFPSSSPRARPSTRP